MPIAIYPEDKVNERDKKLNGLFQKNTSTKTFKIPKKN